MSLFCESITIRLGSCDNHMTPNKGFIGPARPPSPSTASSNSPSKKRKIYSVERPPATTSEPQEPTGHGPRFPDDATAISNKSKMYSVAAPPPPPPSHKSGANDEKTETASNISAREEWMIAPPDAFLRIDPMKPRTFQRTSRTVVDQSKWLETPQERAERIVNESRHGADDTEEVASACTQKGGDRHDAEMSAKVAQYNAQYRGESLMAMHQRARKAKVESADEPLSLKEDYSRFNYERDMKSSTRASDPRQRASMINDASKSLQSRFGKGTYR